MPRRLSYSAVAILTTAGIVASLVTEAIRFFTFINPIDFFFGTVWDPRFAAAGSGGEEGQFGLIPLLAGTLYIAFVSMLFAVPVGQMAAVYMGEYASPKLRSTVKPLLELLAGIPTIVYGIFAVMLVASLFLLVIGRLGLKVFAQAARIPDHTLCPIVVVLCVLGVLLEGGGIFAVTLMVVFGGLGYLMKKLDLSFITFLIGFLLGPMIELSLRQSLILLDGDAAGLVDHPIALVFLFLSAIAIWRLSLRKVRA